MLKVYRVMKAMAEMNGELLLRKPHNMRPMGYSLELIRITSKQVINLC